MGGYGNNSWGNNISYNTIDCRNPLFPSQNTCVSLGHNSTLSYNNIYVYEYNTLELTSGGAHLLVNRNSSVKSSSINIFNNTYSVDGDEFLTLYQSNFFSNVTLYFNEVSSPKLFTNFYGTYYVNFTYVGGKNFIFANNGSNLSLVNQLLQYPYNDLYNVSSSSVFASNIDNYSLTLSSGSQFSVGDFNLSLNFSSGSSSSSIFVNVSSVNFVLGNVSITLYDSSFNVIEIVNSSVVPFAYNFTGLSNSLYYVRVFGFDSSGSSVVSSYYSFVMSGSSCASESDSSLFDGVRIMLILIGVFIIFGGSFALAKGYIDPSPEFIVMFVVGVIMYFACLPVARNLIVGFQC
jgi:hypothetical protein